MSSHFGFTAVTGAILANTFVGITEVAALFFAVGSLIAVGGMFAAANRP